MGKSSHLQIGQKVTVHYHKGVITDRRKCLVLGHKVWLYQIETKGDIVEPRYHCEKTGFKGYAKLQITVPPQPC